MPSTASSPSRLCATLAALALAGSAAALESPIVGPRAMGMGGAGVACSDDYVAQYYNPSAFGFFGRAAGGGGDGKEGGSSSVDNQELARKSWGVGLDLTAGGRIGGDLATYANQLAEINVVMFKNLGSTPNPLAVQDMIHLASSLGTLQPRHDTVTADFNGGMGARIGHFAVGVRGYGQATAYTDTIDLRNLGINASATMSLADKIIAAAPQVAVPTYTPTFFTTAQYQGIVARLSETSSATTAALAAQTLDRQAVLSGTPAAESTNVYAALMGNGTYWNPGVLTAMQTGGPIAANMTMIKATGLGVGELAVSYGYAFNDYISIGGSAKYLLGRVYGLPWYPFRDTRDFQEVMRDARDNYEESSNVGIDAGLMLRVRWLQLGVTGRNLNAPTFKGPTVNGIKFDDQKLDPTVTVGAAFIPWPTFTIAGDADVLVTKTTRDGYDMQRVGGGVEWDIFRFLALRGGVSQNLAESDVGLMYHAGVGFNLWAVRLDVGGMMTNDKVTYDGKEYPREARVSAALATSW